MSQETLVVVGQVTLDGDVPAIEVNLFGQRGGKSYGPQRETILDPKVDYSNLTVADICKGLEMPIKAFARVFNGQRVIDLRSGNNIAAAKTDYTYKSVKTARSALVNAATSEQFAVVANALAQYPALAEDKGVKTLLAAVEYIKPVELTEVEKIALR